MIRQDSCTSHLEWSTNSEDKPTRLIYLKILGGEIQGFLSAASKTDGIIRLIPAHWDESQNVNEKK